MKRITLDDERDYLCWRKGSGGSVEIYDIVVGSERRVGKGKRLIAELVETVRGKTHLIFALTREGNAIARQFYRGCGFRMIGTLNRFHADTGETAIVFGLDIEP